MPIWLAISMLCVSTIAAIFALLAYLRVKFYQTTPQMTSAQLSDVLRSESDRLRQVGAEQARALRQELNDNLRGFQETTLKAFRELGESLGSRVNEFGTRLDTGVRAIDDRAASIGSNLEHRITKMGEDAHQNREALRQTIEGKLDAAALKQDAAARALREEMTGSFGSLGVRVNDTLNQFRDHQQERLENVTQALSSMAERLDKAQELLKQTVEGRLDLIRTENAAKLDEMRNTVDEKLQTTLENRLGESFNRVVEQLERVHKGIGEMQSLASGVGDLKKILSNVRARGTFGEMQIATLLEQFLSPEQYLTNAQVKDNTQERVEFAIRLPGRDGEHEVLLPIDAKFPQEDYERLIVAAENGDAEALADAGKALEGRVRFFAKVIREKYLSPPRTTDFGILFLPTESLYAEILRRPGLFEQLQREYHVTLTGPTTFTALMNALQMGFRSLAIEKRSSEVWQVLGAVKNEFSKYNKVVDTLSRQINTAAKSVENLGIRTRSMTKKLREVEQLPQETAEILLGPALAEIEDTEEDEARDGNSEDS